MHSWTIRVEYPGHTHLDMFLKAQLRINLDFKKALKIAKYFRDINYYTAQIYNFQNHAHLTEFKTRFNNVLNAVKVVHPRDVS